MFGGYVYLGLEAAATRALSFSSVQKTGQGGCHHRLACQRSPTGGVLATERLTSTRLYNRSNRS